MEDYFPDVMCITTLLHRYHIKWPILQSSDLRPQSRWQFPCYKKLGSTEAAPASDPGGGYSPRSFSAAPGAVCCVLRLCILPEKHLCGGTVTNTVRPRRQLTGIGSNKLGNTRHHHIQPCLRRGGVRGSNTPPNTGQTSDTKRCITLAVTEEKVKWQEDKNSGWKFHVNLRG